MSNYPKTVRAVIHVESKVLSLEEEKGFFLEVGDYVEKMHESMLLDKIEIVDQVVVPPRWRPTRDAITEEEARSCSLDCKQVSNATAVTNSTHSCCS